MSKQNKKVGICETCLSEDQILTEIDVGWYDFIDVCEECEEYL